MLYGFEDPNLNAAWGSLEDALVEAGATDNRIGYVFEVFQEGYAYNSLILSPDQRHVLWNRMDTLMAYHGLEFDEVYDWDAWREWYDG